ncbi:ABC transporter ATP-binding protein [Maridesulfovibrio sp.]|uniref:ABC transporter ATP-binding protein n=1 Tax=Maridesulfovibrio sp. TaxID=2795000 RepID=UPI003BA8B6A4
MKIKNLNVSYNGKSALRGINLTLKKGEPLAVLGESGAGKTSFGLAVLGMTPGVTSGEAILDGTTYDLGSISEYSGYRGRKCAMLHQDVDDAFNPFCTIGCQITETPGSKGRYGIERYNQARKMLESVGLDPDLEDAYPRKLSGGQLKRALLSSVLVNDPDCLILDEPTAALDGNSRDVFLELVKRIAPTKYIMIITHDREVALQICPWTAILYGGRIVELGRTEKVLEEPRHPYGRGLLRTAITADRVKDLQGIPDKTSLEDRGCSFYCRCTQRTARCKVTPPSLAGTEEHSVACHRGGIIRVIECKALRIQRQEISLLDELSFNLLEGETLALVGRSGCGKTTLAHTLMGVEKLRGGDIHFEGESVSAKSKEFRSKVSYLAQHPRASVAPHFTVRETVEEPLVLETDYSEIERKEVVHNMLEMVQLSPAVAEKQAHSLSGGELQRVTLARALVRKPRVMILDEPTSALDISTQAKILRLLLDIQEKTGMSMLLITHDLLMARKVSDRILNLDEFKVS